jgi:hypothetical protein
MSADLLRRAAKTLRQHATIATSSPPEEPWTAYRRDDPTRHVVCVELRWLDEGDVMPGGYRVADMSLDAPAEGWPLGQAVVDSQYIALMHPPVALALAEWLEATAAYYDVAYDPLADPVEMDGATVAAIDLARAILREVAP